MTPDEKKQIITQIKHDLDALTLQIENLTLQLQPIAPDCSLGRLTRVEAMNEQAVIARIYQEATRRHSRLTHALSRSDKPMFGLCLECEEEIAIGRMLIRPESLRCVACEKG